MPIPPPPGITPKQMNLLRAVTAMAWSDGALEVAEVELMAQQLSQHFASDPSQQASLAKQIREYFVQRIPLDEILPQISDEAEKRLILKLGYLVIAASARSPEEPLVNLEELEAFQQLVAKLQLPPEVVKQISQEAESELGDPSIAPIEALVKGFTEHYG
ncbi:TerB family tellurite resistance protein [Thermostichus vulcanus]|uniref:TerB family tellurite resistance protein n=1 Tax=Thermostichus vulcanus str. 'Rupite' TaxID=2813851 RepID=A0ABT0CF61_THEVL|nr:TerB family tellurite resistance protein [Thermostichus vulcanus]MCJ2544396.1 TerB family tellurite resistance protein [Thermostichus vulcanus str. 'Rupite']